MIDKNLDYADTSVFPTDCEDLECPVCCQGIPPSCSDDELSCNLKENPSFS